MKFFLGAIFSVFSVSTFSQVVEEVIHLDTDSIVYQVVYKPTLTKKIFSKKIAVFANDTSVKAVGKNYAYDYLNGIYKAYYPTGKIMLFANYTSNRLYGDWTWYDENGDIITKGQYKKGKGVKHGYWAYRSVKLYGRYKKGLKTRTWVQYDANGLKQKSFYKKGKLIRGKGVDDLNTSPIIENNQITQNINIKKEDPVWVKKVQLSREYKQAVSFVTKNVVFRKELKAYFGKTFKEKQRLKKSYKNGQFLYVLSPEVINLDIQSFVNDQKEGKIEVAVIDSVLKNKTAILGGFFNGDPRKNDSNLYQSSTDSTSHLTVYFSEINNNFMRIDVVKSSNTVDSDSFIEAYKLAEATKKFQVLLYFDNQGTLRGAEYQK